MFRAAPKQFLSRLRDLTETVEKEENSRDEICQNDFFFFADASC